MKKSIKKKWVAALRSGDYRQGTGQLRNGDEFCCLGVLCNLHAQEHPHIAAAQGSEFEYLGKRSLLPPAVVAWADLTSDIGPSVKFEDRVLTLPGMNDGTACAQQSFVTIADIIEKQL